jgi:hypothetical protein
MIGHTTAIIEADANKIPTIISIFSEISSSIFKKTMQENKKKVNIAITVDIFNNVEIIEKKDSFYFLLLFMIYSSIILLQLDMNLLNYYFDM